MLSSFRNRRPNNKRGSLTFSSLSFLRVFICPLSSVLINTASCACRMRLLTLIIFDLHLGSELSRAREALDLLQSDLFEQKDYRFCRMRELLMQARPTAQWDTSLKLSKTECARITRSATRRRRSTTC